MKISFHPKPREEFLMTIDYYEECQAELGLEFDLKRIIYFLNPSVPSASLWLFFTGNPQKRRR